MSHFPDRESPSERFQRNECATCEKERKLENKTRIDYWTSYAFEEGHDGESEYVWIRHDDRWYCREHAEEFYEENMFIDMEDTDENDG